LPGYKPEERFLITESNRLDVGVGGNAIQIEVGRGPQQIVAGPLGDVREG
jgi:hypothetical protein